MDGDVRNLPTRYTEWKMHTTTCLRNWNQNMVIIETVTRASQNTLIAWYLPQMILKQFRNYNVWAFFHSFWTVIFKRDCCFCNTEWRKKIWEKCIWTNEASSVWMSRLEYSAWNCREKKKGQKTLRCCYPRFWFICMWSTFSQQLSQTMSEKPTHWYSANEEKQETQDLEETHRTAITSICDLIEKEIFRTKES